MTSPAKILLVGDDPLVATLQDAVEEGGRARVLLAPDEAEAWGVARRERPDLIVSLVGGWDESPFGLCRRLKSDADLSGCPFVMVVDPDAAEIRAAGLEAGVDDYITRPVDPAQLLAKLQACLRIRKLHDALGAAQLEIERLRGTLHTGVERLTSLLVNLVNMSIPGAADRGNRLADMSRKLATRFEIPPEFLRDLEFVARVRELGRLAFSASEERSRPPCAAPDGWQYVLSTQAILKQTDRLPDAADLVGCIYENWDGSGMPRHLQQGQIPLRSRILRVLIDFYAALDARNGAKPDEVLADLAEQGGTHYDPMVLVHLQALLEDAPEKDWRGSRLLLPVTALAEGMVLAEDLYTGSGVKLLSREATITSHTLEAIQRRNRFDPILRGAVVYCRQS